MPRYDLYKVEDGYVIDLQTDIVDISGSRIVAPVVPQAVVPAQIKGLHPLLIIDGVPHVVATHLLAAVPTSLLRIPMGNFATQGDALTRGLDILFQGY